MSGSICRDAAITGLRSRRHSNAAARWRGIAIRIVDGVLAWQERARSRRMLATFDERMLRDIGIDRATAAEEASTPFWRRSSS